MTKGKKKGRGGVNETVQAAEGQWLGGEFALDSFRGHGAVLPVGFEYFCFIGKVWLQLVGMLLGRDHHRPWPQVSPLSFHFFCSLGTGSPSIYSIHHRHRGLVLYSSAG
jgi:hypothetical protein